MPLASKQLAIAKKNANVTGYDVKSLKMTFKYFGPRLIATAGGWFCNDVFFYGNKLFQSQFISVISPAATKEGNIMTNWLWNLVNVGVSLVGYYLASFLIDNKLYGRKMMQQVGFLMCFILFVVPAFHYNYYAKEIDHIPAFQAMYFLSSFFNQFGPKRNISRRRRNLSHPRPCHRSRILRCCWQSRSSLGISRLQLL